MGDQPKLGFDTNPLNHLLDDTDSKTVMTAIRLAYEIVLPALSFEEILSVPITIRDRRDKLFDLCEHLLHWGQCLFPFHWILTRLITAHHNDPANFDWTKVPVRAGVFERAIREKDFPDDVCAVQRREQFEMERKSWALWRSPRPLADKVFAETPSFRPKNFREAVELSNFQGSDFWMTGEGLYRRITKTELSEAEFWAFMEACPPFRAFYYSLTYRWFDGALKSRNPADLKPAGRNDLAMSVYLPYCQKFIADDGAQTPNLREIAREANIDCEVLNYAEFSASFNATPTVTHLARS